MPRLQDPDGDAGDRLAEVVEHVAADHAHPGQREVDLISDFLLRDLQRPALFAGTTLAVGQREIATALDTQRVAAGSHVAELVASVGGGARGPRRALELVLGRETHLRPPEGLTCIHARDAAADDAAGLDLLVRAARCSAGRSRCRNLRLGRRREYWNRESQDQGCQHALVSITAAWTEGPGQCPHHERHVFIVLLTASANTPPTAPHTIATTSIPSADNKGGGRTMA